MIIIPKPDSPVVIIIVIMMMMSEFPSGEMESAKMIGSAIQNNPGFVELRRIDAAKEISHHMAVSRNKMVVVMTAGLR